MDINKTEEQNGKTSDTQQAEEEPTTKYLIKIKEGDSTMYISKREEKTYTKEDVKQIKEIIELTNKIKDKSEYSGDSPIVEHFFWKTGDEVRYKPLGVEKFECYLCEKSCKENTQKVINEYFDNLKSEFDALITTCPEEPLFYIERAKLYMSYYCYEFKSPEEKYNLCFSAAEDYEKAAVLMENPSKEFLYNKIEIEAKIKLYDEIMKDYERLKNLYILNLDDYYEIFSYGDNIKLFSYDIKIYDKFFADFENMIIDECSKNEGKECYGLYSFIELCLYRKDYKKVIKWCDVFIKAALLHFDKIHNIDRGEIPFSENNYDISLRGLKLYEEYYEQLGTLTSLEEVFRFRAIAKQNLNLYDEAIKDYINYFNINNSFWGDSSALNELFKLYKNSENKKEKILKEIIKNRNKYIFKYDKKYLKEYKIGIFWLSEDESKVITANINTVKDILKQHKTDAPDIFYPELSYEKAWQTLDKEEIIKAGGNPDKNGWQSLKHGYVAYDFIKGEFIFAGGKWLTSKLILTKFADIFGIKIRYNGLYGLDTRYIIEHIAEFDDITDKKLS